MLTYNFLSFSARMELALQVVGLKMTGKIEDGRDVAMRIVGTTQDALQMTSPTNTNSEQQVINALNVMDSLPACENTRSVKSIVSHQSTTGQTLLHLACFGDFPLLVDFLIEHEIDLNVRDKNGCTALHFAALSGSQTCAGKLIDAGADMTAEDAMGRTPVQISSPGFFRPLLTRVRIASQADEESQWGDGEDSDAEEKVAYHSHVSSRRSRRSRSHRSSKPASLLDDEPQIDIDTTADDDDGATVVAPESLSSKSPLGKSGIDEKITAPFAEYFQRAWAQIQAQQLVPNMPNIPNMPQLPGMPEWVFPVYVPITAWPPFRAEKRNGEDESDKDKSYDSAVEPRSPASEWRVYWEKWMMAAHAGKLPSADLPTKAKGISDKPVQVNDGLSGVDGSSVSADGAKEADAELPVESRSLLRRFGYRLREKSISRTKTVEHVERPESSVATIKKGSFSLNIDTKIRPSNQIHQRQRIVC